MNRWRGAWAATQITGVIFSSLVWIVVSGLSLPALVMAAVIGVTLVVGRNTGPMLWWRFGATPANAFQGDMILTAIIPIPSLRGRHQPSVWIGRRLLGAQAVMPASTLLLVSPDFVGRIASGRLTGRQASTIISQTLGTVEIVDSALVNAFEAYCLPWRLVQVLVVGVSQFAARHRTLRISWSIRWIVFGVAIVDNYFNGRWAAFVGVILIAVLSWTTGFFQKRCDHRSRTWATNSRSPKASEPTSPISSSAATAPSPPAKSRPTPPHLSRRNDRSRRPDGRRRGTVRRADRKASIRSRPASNSSSQAFGGRFTNPSQPWVQQGDDPGRWWIDVEQMTEDPLSGGETRLHRIAASLLGGPPVDLSRNIAGLDREHLRFVLAAIDHAGGGNEPDGWPEPCSDHHYDDTGGITIRTMRLGRPDRLGTRIGGGSRERH